MAPRGQEGVQAQALAPVLTSLLWLQVLLEEGLGEGELSSEAFVTKVVKQQSSVCSF